MPVGKAAAASAGAAKQAAPVSDDFSGSGPARRSERQLAIARLTAFLALLVLGAVLACVMLGSLLARQNDDTVERERRAALRSAIENVRAISDITRLDRRFMVILEAASGLKDLRFETDPVADEREAQSVLDDRGRILGWFTWERERPMTDALTRLMPMLVITGIGLLVFAGLALWQLGRSTRRLADSEARAWQLAYQDPLTGLPTYARLLDLIANALADRKADEIVALALIDIVGFREINDTLGHAGTDELLATLAQRLKAALPNHIVADGPARDEFSVLIAASDGAAVKTALDGAVEALSRQYWINQAVEINFVIGRAQVPGDAATPDELTRRANLALHSASRKSRWHIAAFRPDMEKDFHERTFITRELRRALAGDMLDVHYQPIVTANGAVIAGVEALLRWNHAARGAIPPSVFVPVAEQTGLMQELGSFILRRALRDAMRWPNIYVSVNLSPVQVRDPAFVRVAADAIAESGIEPGRVVLEITEGVLIETPEESKASLEVLRGLGIKLALDDFGSGYSNLGYLQKYPIDKIKIDKSFVDPLGGPAIGGAIIQAIVALGRALGLQVCAEGVETEQQRVLLRLAGCDEMQGFLFSKPVPRNEIDRLLAARPAPATRPARAALSA